LNYLQKHNIKQSKEQTKSTKQWLKKAKTTHNNPGQRFITLASETKKEKEKSCLHIWYGF